MNIVMVINPSLELKITCREQGAAHLVRNPTSHFSMQGLNPVGQVLYRGVHGLGRPGTQIEPNPPLAGSGDIIWASLISCSGLD